MRRLEDACPDAPSRDDPSDSGAAANGNHGRVTGACESRLFSRDAAPLFSFPHHASAERRSCPPWLQRCLLQLTCSIQPRQRRALTPCNYP